MSAHVRFSDDGTRAEIGGEQYAPHDRLPDGEQAGVHVARWAINHRRSDEERGTAARYLATCADWRRLAAAIVSRQALGVRKTLTDAERQRRAARLAAARAKRWPNKKDAE